ncbi:hypothetical protein [Aquirufa ecclesiirivi]|uniref:hypothetical protein n=1 Tax=Aquirufa ecclesiirivi TaxID=2715124 RepID=UPI0023D82AD8|nr:hypothetical protein [Aquirufa ecclesiirivi]MDF0693969.1 hypothetical protein [Aquirufa ecclesiirivi]
MSFNSIGYKIKLIQKDICKDSTDHALTYIYKFFSPKTKLNYVIRAEYHSVDIFIVKFYVQSLYKSFYRYSIVTNRGDLANIVITCCSIVPELLIEYPTASFGFMGGRSVDHKSKNKKTKQKRAESLENNQRFRIYSRIAALKFGTKTFRHIEYENISSYLLLNNYNINQSNLEEQIKTSLISTYPDLLNYL